MRNFILYIFIAIASLLAIASGTFSIEANSAFLTVDPICSSLDYLTVSDTTSNAFHTWRIGPINCLLAKTISSSPSFSLLSFSYLLIFFLGLAKFFHAESKLSRLSIFLTNISLTLALYLLFAGNIVVAGTLAWIPWYICSLSELKKEESTRVKAFHILFVVLIVFSANQLALFALLVPLFIVVHSRFSFLTAIIGSLFSFTAKVPTFPKYPALARVVEDDGLPGIIRPLIGPDSPIQVISQNLLLQNYTATALVICVLSLAFMMFCSRSKKSLGTIIAISLLIDFFGNSHLIALGPVRSLSRIVPGTSLLALSVPFLAMFALFTALSLTKRKQLAPIFSMLLLALALCTSYLGTSGSLNYLAEASKTESKIISPSLNVYLQNSPMLVKNPESLTNYESLRLNKNNAQITSSHRNDQRVLRRILDISPATRWSTGLGKQTGSEWLLIKLSEPTLATGIEINVGKFSADFPRGLKIYSIDSCTVPEINTEENLIRISNPWQGVIKFTPEGYPYYGSQSKVRTFFNKEEKIKCLLIKQTGTSDSFEWSVTSIDLLK